MSKELRAKSHKKKQGTQRNERRAKVIALTALHNLLYTYCYLLSATCLVLIVLCSLLIFIGGCGSQKYYLRQGVDIKNIKTIAVFPLENLTSDDYAGEKIRNIIITELLSKQINVVEPGEVTNLLKEMKIKSLKLLKVEDMQNIGKTLGADAIIVGAVEAFGISRGVSVNYPEVTVNLRLIETTSGQVIWSIRHTSGGPDFWMRHFGSEGPSLSETARKVVKEAIATIF